MPTSPLAVEPFEDRTAPSRGGFGPVASFADHGFAPRPDDHPGPQPAQLRENHAGDGRDGPFVGFDTPRDAPTPLPPRGPIAAERGPFDPARFVARVAAARDAGEQVPARPLVVANATADDAPVDAPRAEPAAAPAAGPVDRASVPAARPVTAAVVATPSGLTATLSGAFFAPPITRAEGAPSLIVTPSGSVPARGEPMPAALQAVAVSSSVAFTSPGDGGADEPTRPTPDAPAPHEPAWDFKPLVVEVPGLVPLAGALGVDLVAVEGGVRDVFDRLAALADLPGDGAGATAWLTTAAVLAGGAAAAGYAGARAKRGRGAADLPIDWEVRR